MTEAVAAVPARAGEARADRRVGEAPVAKGRPAEMSEACAAHAASPHAAEAAGMNAATEMSATAEMATSAEMAATTEMAATAKAAMASTAATRERR